MQVSLDYLLQFKIDHKALLQCIEAGNNKLRFYQSTFYQELFDFYYDLFKSDDDIYTKFKQTCCCKHYQHVYLISK